MKWVAFSELIFSILTKTTLKTSINNYQQSTFNSERLGHFKFDLKESKKERLKKSVFMKFIRFNQFLWWLVFFIF